MLNSNLRPLSFKAQKVLPLVFDDSLSYYEQLSKLTHTMNLMIDVLNNTIDDTIKDFIDARFNDIMLEAVYDEKTETLTLSLNIGEVA